MFKEGTNCINHKNSQFLFYCFDDKSYLCEECFRDHKSHHVEIKADIKKVSVFVELLKKSNSKNIKILYENIEKQLKDLKDEIEKILSEIKKISEKFKEREEIPTPDDISKINYENFENLINCINIKSKVVDISKNSITTLDKIKNNVQGFLIPSNLKYINKEVSIINNSNIYSNFTIDIMLGKSSVNSYTLFSTSQNHFLIVDLNKNYYLNSIRIQVTNDDCSLKNFAVFIKETNKDNEDWLKISDFIRKRENQNDQYESFNIGHYCRQVKFNFIDTWGTSSGNYIIIKRIDFEVGE